MVRSSSEAVGDDAVVAATGQPRQYWFELLDAHDAMSWTHKQIAAWLVSEQGVDGWWAQSLTVAYEQAHGRREPGQREDGTFEVSPSKTLECSLVRAYELVADDAERTRWLDPALVEVRAGERSEVLAATPSSSVRLAWPSGALGAPEGRDGRVAVTLYQPTDSTGAPTGKVRVSIAHGGLTSREDAETLRSFWKGRLDALAAACQEG
ncbi:hypothetical protein [Antribacter gilvus]|uniref:hypothetical protein n=1 Tax=Antribacter gilvus TaxID=2304675 RepID=UPI000F76FB2D|nr:hypothetical protein [Antribacter gilvus]